MTQRYRVCKVHLCSLPAVIRLDCRLGDISKIPATWISIFRDTEYETKPIDQTIEACLCPYVPSLNVKTLNIQTLLRITLGPASPSDCNPGAAGAMAVRTGRRRKTPLFSTSPLLPTRKVQYVGAEKRQAETLPWLYAVSCDIRYHFAQQPISGDRSLTLPAAGLPSWALGICLTIARLLFSTWLSRRTASIQGRRSKGKGLCINSSTPLVY